MSMRSLLVWFWSWFLLSPALAQDAAALLAKEQQLQTRAVAALHELAEALAMQKQHHRALELRREIWLDYAPDDVPARERTGFVRVGDQWRKDDAKVVLDRDLKGSRC